MLKNARREVSAVKRTDALLALHLSGPAVKDGRISLSDLAELANGLQSAVLRVAEVLAGKPESGRPGRTSQEIADVCVLEVTGMVPGSLGLTMDLQSPKQLHLLEDRDLGHRAIDGLVSGGEALPSSNGPLPAGYDTGVVKAIVDMSHILDHGVNEVTLTTGRQLPPRRTTINRVKRDALSARVGHTTTRSRVVEGRLLMGDFKETGYQCRIHPPAGSSITCTFDEELRWPVLSALTHHVRVEGEATERNGSIVKLHIESIVPVAAQPDSLGGVFSMPFDAELSLAELAAQQGVKPIKSIDDLRMATWPEDESVDDLVATVRAWRDEGE